MKWKARTESLALFGILPQICGHLASLPAHFTATPDHVEQGSSASAPGCKQLRISRSQITTTDNCCCQTCGSHCFTDWLWATRTEITADIKHSRLRVFSRFGQCYISVWPFEHLFCMTQSELWAHIANMFLFSEVGQIKKKDPSSPHVLDLHVN